MPVFNDGPLLCVEDLEVAFAADKTTLKAVRQVSFQMSHGTSLGIVGESGSGKSALVHAICGLSEGIVSGKIELEGKSIQSPKKEIGMVFQDPMSALNPTMRVGPQITEGLIYHGLCSKQEATKRGKKLLELVGIENVEERFNQYPHQLSGGMRQRVLIAIALAMGPKLLIADEPTTALDVTIQIQILELIKKMKDLFKMSLLLISHDFSVIASVCEEVLVMYAGKIVERGSIQKILTHPRHPYTQLLLHSLPRIDRPKLDPLIPIEGLPPNLAKLPKGCAFKERCPYRALKCDIEPKGDVACWRVQ